MISPKHKVIETYFNGHHFRSRLEARWAVVYARLGIQYLYEPEGFVLNGIRYLPDFYLPKQDCYVEIKPVVPTQLEQQLAGDLSEFTGKRVFIFYGTPQCGTYDISSNESESAYAYFPEGADNAYWWCECPHCGKLDIQFNGRADRIKCECPRSAHGDKGYNSESKLLEYAFWEARCFRF